MRTLVLGIPLPHVTFDNYSFLSAPSLFDHDWVIVEMSALSEAVSEVVAGPADHKTHGGLTIVNGPTTTTAFSLAELLRLRRLEADRLLARGGVIACFAYPDVAHEGISDLPAWRRYDWLPTPEGFAYAEGLLAGYGKLGAELSDPEHAFAPYVEEFGVRLAFRAYLSEPDGTPPPYATVFARSPGGAAVGIDLEVGPGRVVLLPPIGNLDYSRDRAPLAAVLHQCLERMTAGGPEKQSHWLGKEAS